jgi:hypothetical protein
VQTEPETRTRQEYYDLLSSGRGQEIVSFAALMAERPASERHEWQIPLSQGEVGRCGLVMSRQTFIFVGAQARDPDLMHLVEQTLGGTFRFEEGTDPYIRLGTVAVYVGEHDFDDGDIAWPGGSDVPLRSMYPAMIEFRDTGGDRQRQQAIAGQVFAALESTGRWSAVYIDDMQKILDSYQPAG